MKIQDQVGVINCKGPQILPHLQANKTAGHSFTDALCQRLQSAKSSVTENFSSKRSLLFGGPESRECALPWCTASNSAHWLVLIQRLLICRLVNKRTKSIVFKEYNKVLSLLFARGMGAAKRQQFFLDCQRDWVLWICPHGPKFTWWISPWISLGFISYPCW